MGISGVKWVNWWKADAVHAIHPNHEPDPGKGFGFGGVDGIAYCGKTIPARGTYPPSNMSIRCNRCLAELRRKELDFGRP